MIVSAGLPSFPVHPFEVAFGREKFFRRHIQIAYITLFLTGVAMTWLDELTGISAMKFVQTKTSNGEFVKIVVS